MPTKDFLEGAKPAQTDFLAGAKPVGEKAAPPASPPAQPSLLKRGQDAFDKLTTVTPEQEASARSISSVHPQVGELLNQAQKFGAGAIGTFSPIVHPLDTINGVVGSISHPVEAGKSILKSAVEHPAQTAGGLVGGAALGMAGEAAGANLIPTRAKAGKLFSEVAKDAENQPVALTRTAPQLQKMMQLGREGGGTVPVPVRQLANAGGAVSQRSVPLLRQMQNELNGASGPVAQPSPLLYPSARNFQSGLASLSREDAKGMGGPMKGQLRQVNKAFFDDIKDAASEVGRGDEYVKAMNTFRRASQLRNGLIGAAKWGVGPVVGGSLLYPAVKSLIPNK